MKWQSYTAVGCLVLLVVFSLACGGSGGSGVSTDVTSTPAGGLSSSETTLKNLMQTMIARKALVVGNLAYAQESAVNLAGQTATIYGGAIDTTIAVTEEEAELMIGYMNDIAMYGAGALYNATNLMDDLDDLSAAITAASKPGPDGTIPMDSFSIKSDAWDAFRETMTEDLLNTAGNIFDLISATARANASISTDYSDLIQATDDIPEGFLDRLTTRIGNIAKNAFTEYFDDYAGAPILGTVNQWVSSADDLRGKAAEIDKLATAIGDTLSAERAMDSLDSVSVNATSDDSGNYTIVQNERGNLGSVAYVIGYASDLGLPEPQTDDAVTIMGTFAQDDSIDLIAVDTGRVPTTDSDQILGALAIAADDLLQRAAAAANALGLSASLISIGTDGSGNVQITVNRPLIDVIAKHYLAGTTWTWPTSLGSVDGVTTTLFSEGFGIDTSNTISSNAIVFSTSDIDTTYFDITSTTTTTTTGTWYLTDTTANLTSALTVDSSGNFTGSGWVGTAVGCSDYPLPISNGRMSGTSVTFDVSGSYCSGTGTITGSGTGTLNASFPAATGGSGTWGGTIVDPLGTRSFTDNWTLSKQ